MNQVEAEWNGVSRYESLWNAIGMKRLEMLCNVLKSCETMWKALERCEKL